MASSCTITLNPQQSKDYETAILKFAWTADTDGSFSSVSTDDTQYNPQFTITDLIKGFEVVYAQTNPGGTAPTDNYDITITDGDSEDIFGGNLANRDTSNTESAFPLVGGVSAVRILDSALTLAITNNAVNSATGTVKLFLQRPI